MFCKPVFSKLFMIFVISYVCIYIAILTNVQEILFGYLKVASYLALKNPQLLHNYSVHNKIHSMIMLKNYLKILSQSIQVSTFSWGHGSRPP